MILPLLKSLDIFMNNRVLTDLGSIDEATAFSQSLLPRLKAEVSGCKDVKKLMAVLMVLGHLVVLADATRPSVLSSMMLLLGHRFPRVRKATAEQLYLRLMELEDMSDDSHEGALEKLSGVVWDDDDLKKVREERDTIAKLLGVTAPTAASSSNIKGETRRQASDDLESYASLVKEAGY